MTTRPLSNPLTMRLIMSKPAILLPSRRLALVFLAMVLITSLKTIPSQSWLRSMQDSILVQASGANSVDKANFAMFNGLAFSRNSDTVMGTNLVAGLSAYAEMLKTNHDNVRTLADNHKFTEDDPREDYFALIAMYV